MVSEIEKEKKGVETKFEQAKPETDAPSQGKDYQKLYLDEKKTSEEFLTRLKYMQADFENFKKRMAKERIETIKFANEALMQDILPSLDEFDSALDKMKDSEEKKGVQLIRQNLLLILKENGLSQMQAMEVFDPNFHECILQEKTADEKLDGKVSKVIQKGYLLNGDVLRFAKVAVYKV